MVCGIGRTLDAAWATAALLRSATGESTAARNDRRDVAEQNLSGRRRERLHPYAPGARTVTGGWTARVLQSYVYLAAHAARRTPETFECRPRHAVSFSPAPR